MIVSQKLPTSTCNVSEASQKKERKKSKIAKKKDSDISSLHSFSLSFSLGLCAVSRLNRNGGYKPSLFGGLYDIGTTTTSTTAGRAVFQDVCSASA